MKFFSKPIMECTDMKTDGAFRILLNIAIGAISGFGISLAVPDVELGRVTFAITAAMFIGILDARDRAKEIFRQNCRLLDHAVQAENDFEDLIFTHRTSCTAPPIQIDEPGNPFKV